MTLTRFSQIGLGHPVKLGFRNPINTNQRFDGDRPNLDNACFRWVANRIAMAARVSVEFTAGDEGNTDRSQT